MCISYGYNDYLVSMCITYDYKDYLVSMLDFIWPQWLFSVSLFVIAYDYNDCLVLQQILISEMSVYHILPFNLLFELNLVSWYVH